MDDPPFSPINTSKKKLFVCFKTRPFSMWQNNLQVSKEYFATSQKVNPRGLRILNDAAWNM
jgi:hypothetical protein